MDVKGYECLIFHYGRVELFHTMQKTVMEAIEHFPSQLIFKFYNGVSLVLNQHIHEATQELIALKNVSNISEGVIEALLYLDNYHQASLREDQNNFTQSNEDCQHIEIVSNRQQNSVESLYSAAVFLFLVHEYSKSKRYINRILQIDEKHEASLILKNWLLLHLERQNELSVDDLQLLEEMCTGDYIIGASLLLVHYYNSRSKFDISTNLLNRLSIRYPEINMPLVAKMDTRLAALNFEQAYEISLRIINLEPTNIQALCVKAFLLIAHEGDIKGGISSLQQLLVATERMEEEGNMHLMLRICQLFARISSRNPDVLNLTLRFIEKQTQTSTSSDIEFVTELGNQRLLLGNIKEANVCFRSVLRAEKDHYRALSGVILCQLLDQNGTIESIRQQIEYLVQLETLNNNRHPFTLYLRAKLLSNADEAVALLIEAVELHMKRLENQLYSLEYVHLLNPDFLLLIIMEMLYYCPIQLQKKQCLPIDTHVHISLKEAINVLDIVLKCCPSNIQAIFLRAKIHVLCGEINIASKYLLRIINDLDPMYTAAYLLLAKNHIQSEHYSKALQYLELALSHNFTVRCNATYNLMVGIVMRKLRKFQDAEKSFKTALSLLNVRVKLSNQELLGVEKIHAADPDLNNFTVADKVTLYLELISTLKDIGDSKSLQESERLLAYAMQEFNNTPEEGRLLIAQAEFLTQSGQIQKTIELLSNVKPEQTYYIQTRTYLANIHLQYYKDQISFAQCFRKLVNVAPNSYNYQMLGEALLSIQEPDQAIEAYQHAYELNPSDLSLITRFGKIYVKAHYYKSAIDFYKTILNENDNNIKLKLELVDVYIKLNKFRSAEEELQDDDTMDKNNTYDIEDLQLRTTKLLTLAHVYEKLGNSVDTIKTLEIAMKNQLRIQKRILIDRSGNHHQEAVSALSRITLKLAQHLIGCRNYKSAVQCYKDYLEYNPDDIDILIALGRLFMQMDSLESCQEICLQILKIDNLNLAASIMMADFSLRKMDLENATYYFSQILLTQPCYWIALSRLIEVMRRLGTLNNIKPFLIRSILEGNRGNSQDIGLYYCRGLYEWYSGNPNAALRFFNKTRRNPEWCQQGLINMIKICISFDNDLPMDYSEDLRERLDEEDGGETGDDSLNARLAALNTAQRLLKELRRLYHKDERLNNELFNYKLLSNFFKLATKRKSSVESALQDFTHLMTSEALHEGSIGPILGVATALFQLKQSQQAKTYLKPLARVPWKLEEAEYLENSWLLLSSIYVNSSKWEAAQALVDKVLFHNKSSLGGHVLRGIIAEKVQMYANAAKSFHTAWEICGHSRSFIGHRLIYNHMKCRDFSAAMEVYDQLLAQHDDSNIICKDILERCSNLRS